MEPVILSHLFSGGIITNYYCSSQCAHCLYACSPAWKKNYMHVDIAYTLFERIKQLGCDRVHIGGGEPFLDIHSLLEILRCAQKQMVYVEYIETNSSWYKDEESALEILDTLQQGGLDTLLLSMSPFHNEYIPFYKGKGFFRACKSLGIAVFPWVQDFYSEINAFDETRPHTLKEYCQKYGEHYVARIPNRYWIHYGGRALQLYEKLYPLQHLMKILQTSKGCVELIDTSHFHFDLFGNYIPGLCSGIALKAQDIGQPLDPDKYIFFYLLYYEGVRALLEYAQAHYGFRPAEFYLSKCHLCFDIRKHIVVKKKILIKEFRPVEYYESMTK